jgi:hypothetical protein
MAPPSTRRRGDDTAREVIGDDDAPIETVSADAGPAPVDEGAGDAPRPFGASCGPHPDRTAQNNAQQTPAARRLNKVRRMRADRASMENSALSVIVLFIAATLYIMRRRVRLGRRKPTF